MSRLDWKAEKFHAYSPRGIYTIERECWDQGYELRFRAMLPGWPRSESVHIDPEPDADGNARDWADLESAMAAAERHASLFDHYNKQAG